MSRGGRACRISTLSLIATALAALAAVPRANAQPTSAVAYAEHEVKAAFLFNFASYVQWPAAARAEARPITFAVLDAPPVETALERLSRGRTLQGRPVRVRHLRSVNDLAGDEVVFIGASENWRLSQLIAAVSGPTLIVTDAPDGLSAGAMINFQLVDRRVRFEIALPAAEAAGLTLSSRLLSAALRVETTRCWLECRLPRPRSFVVARSGRAPIRGEAAFGGLREAPAAQRGARAQRGSPPAGRA